MMFYTGIGSRETPKIIQQQMTAVAKDLADLGFTLRSGKARGADLAFELGALQSANPKMEIYVIDKFFGKGNSPCSDFDIIIDGDLRTFYSEIAKKLHPAWNKCNDWARSQHSRNICQVQGCNPDKLVLSDFVLFWAEVDDKGRVQGGTATAVKRASKLNIPCINMLFDGWETELANAVRFSLLNK